MEDRVGAAHRRLDAWLAATAKHRAIDELRRRRRLACHARARTAAETDWGTLRA